MNMTNNNEELQTWIADWQVDGYGEAREQCAQAIRAATKPFADHQHRDRNHRRRRRRHRARVFMVDAGRSRRTDRDGHVGRGVCRDARLRVVELARILQGNFGDDCGVSRAGLEPPCTVSTSALCRVDSCWPSKPSRSRSGCGTESNVIGGPGANRAVWPWLLLIGMCGGAALWLTGLSRWVRREAKVVESCVATTNSKTRESSP